jgi:regulator of replication initiation timing
MVFALTRAHPHTIPRNYDHRQQSINSLLNGMKYSLELVDIVRSMVERNDSKRITNSQLRRILKEKETQIIHYEQMHPTIRVRKN